MDFNKIFYNGLSNRFNRADLKSYCEREYKKAEQEHYTPESFFNPLLDIIKVSHLLIQDEYDKKLKQLNNDIEIARNNEHSFSGYGYGFGKLKPDSLQWKELQIKLNKEKFDDFTEKKKNLSIDSIVIHDCITINGLNEFEKAIKQLLDEAPKPFNIPESVLKQLEERKFIENAKATPIKWLKNKQLLRELLTHDKIKIEWAGDFGLTMPAFSVETVPL